MIFKAVKTIGTFQIETLESGNITYTIQPFDANKMAEVEALSSNQELRNDERILGQIQLFCPEFERSHFDGVPLETLTQMLEYIIETSQGKKRTEAEKKTAQKEHTKS